MNVLFKEAIKKRVAEETLQYDCETGLLVRKVRQHKGTFYTSLSGEYHIIRESIFYAVGLMLAEPQKNAGEAEKIILKACNLQDKEPESETFGVWPLYMEEPLNQQPRPDWNWSDFCGKGLLQFVIDFRDFFSDETLQIVRESVKCAAYRIMKRDVSPAYTNISVMGSYVTIVAGEYLNDEKLRNYARERFEKVYAYNMYNQCVSEYNSPTYTIEALTDLSLIRKHSHDERIRETADRLLEMQWRFTLDHYCAENAQWTGPHSRCYETMQNERYLSFLQVGFGDRRKLIEPERMIVEPMWLQADMYIPDKLIGAANAKGNRFFHRHPVLRNEPYVEAANYRERDLSLGSFSFCDFWTQRRPLIAYWGDTACPYYMRLRLMHDDFDFASGLMSCIQNDNVIVGAVGMCSDHGDRHFTMDPIVDEKITAEYFAYRFEFGGANIKNSKMEVKRDGNRYITELGGAVFAIWIADAAFGDSVPEVVWGETDNSKYLDIVLYHGRAKQLEFNELRQAYASFVMGMFRKGDYAEIEQMFSRASRSGNTVYYKTAYAENSVTYPTEIMKYNDMVRAYRNDEKLLIIPARHVWRVTAKKDFGES